MILSMDPPAVLRDRAYSLLERRLSGLGAVQTPLSIRLWNGRVFGLTENPEIEIRIEKPSALRHVFFPSLDGLSQAYVEGEIDLKGSMRNAIRIAEALSSGAETTIPDLKIPKIRKIGFRSKRSDAKAVRYHYDVSNDFYRLWLDRNMVYSCGYFKTETDDIDRAQENKLDHICRKLLLQPGDRFLDVGCGWGGLVIWAARHYGVKALGITISREQFEYAQRRIQEEGLSDRCEVKLMDYRDLNGERQFDKISSIGMFEHVGLKNLNLYFGRLYRSLRDGGRLLNHGITSSRTSDRPKSRGGGQFIDKYVFPDGELPHISLAIQRMEEEKLETIDVESLRPHYAKTLSQWHERFSASAPKARELVGEKRFRIWNAYLAGCGHAFERGWVSIFQVTCVKGARSGPWAPLTRDYIYQEMRRSC